MEKNKVFPIIVDYSQSLTAMIAAGKYDWVSPYISSFQYPAVSQGLQNSRQYN